jgi:CHAD domain-containing protein
MSYRIRPTKKVRKEFRRVAREQVGHALDDLDDEALDDHETVHEVRKRGKKVRALARLVRGAFDGYSDANAAVRDMARRVADLRDAKVRLDTFDELTGGHRRALDEAALAAVRAALLAEREALHRRVQDENRLAAVREDLEAIRDAVDDWKLDAQGFDTVADGFAKTYRRGREAMAAAYDDPTPERFHEWRKRAKYHRYHVRLLEGLWPGPFGAWRERLHDLTDLLGEGNDLTELTRAGEPLAAAGADAEEVIRALAEHRRAELWEEARDLGEDLYGDPADEMTGRLAKVWKAAS